MRENDDAGAARAVARRKWDLASRSYDWLAFAEKHRLGPHKRRLFAKIRGDTMMVAAGTGNDFQFLPPGHPIDAVDISPKMLERAAVKAAMHVGPIRLHEMDVCALAFADASFDTVVTTCTFCSVPRPVVGLRELHRVLRPGGQLLMFEHVRSKIGPLGIYLDLVTPWIRRYGPDLNRDTVRNVERAGFRIRREENVYLDIVKAIEATKDLEHR